MIGLRSTFRRLAPVMGLLTVVTAAGIFGTAGKAQAATAAGTTITNTASATYVDPNNPGTTLNSTSNTVVVTVAEVAGVTVYPSGVANLSNSTSILPGNTLQFDFVVTNTGNDPTHFIIPAAVTVTGPITQTGYTFSQDGGNTYNAVSTTAPGSQTNSYPAGGTVRVRVTATVNANAVSGALISVLLGNTPPNDGSVNAENQPFVVGHTNNLYTKDVDADGGTEVAGAPVNGEREASALSNARIGAQPFAFASIMKTHTGHTQGTDLQHDTITYGLSLTVVGTAFPGSSQAYIPADLVGTPNVSVDGTPSARILISDAIPASTQLNAALGAVAGFKAVYTTSATTIAANQAVWTTTPPATFPATTVTRVGYVNDTSVGQPYITSVPKGTTIAFNSAITVLTNGVSLTQATNIYNISQLYGGSNNGQNTSYTTGLVYDESGDQNPSNLNDDGSTGPAPTNGVAVPATDGLDSSNNNTGQGPGGEDNVYTEAPPGTILNGPNGSPGAVGPTDNNDDFTNLSSPIAAGMAPGSLFAAPVTTMTFTNTIQNPGNTSLTNILIYPVPPTVLTGGTAADVPTGTTAAVSYGGNTAVYTYNGTVWSFSSGVVINIATLTASNTATYTVAVTLPTGTPLSTDTLKGFPVVMKAGSDANNNGQVDVAEPQNNTVDREYTGFLKLTKAVRVLDSTQTPVAGASGSYSTAPLTADIVPGNYLQYQIIYKNISTVAAGQGNVILNASNVVITEDGAVAGGNNWATMVNGVLVTSNAVGGSVDSNNGVITFYNGFPETIGTDITGTTQATDVTKYVDTVPGLIGPQVQFNLTFKRKIN